jgi:hypothetical protein
VYFVLALGLFEHVGAALVWGKLVAGLAGLTGVAVPSPSEKAVGAGNSSMPCDLGVRPKL